MWPAGRSGWLRGVGCAYRRNVHHGLDRFLGWVWAVEADGRRSFCNVVRVLSVPERPQQRPRWRWDGIGSQMAAKVVMSCYAGGARAASSGLRAYCALAIIPSERAGAGL